MIERERSMQIHKILQIILWFVLTGGGVNSVLSEVKDSSVIGFTIEDTVMISADPDDVYHALVADIGSWWDSAHTFSGNANNLSLDDKAGGCFCEKLEHGGSVRHLEVVFAAPGKTLRMIGGLGPLQSMAVTGSMTWALNKANNGTTVTVTYSVGGYRPGGLQKLAPLVDTVMSEQLYRLKNFIEMESTKK